MSKCENELTIESQLVQNFRDIGHVVHRMSESKGSQIRILSIIKEAGIITQSRLTQMLGIQPGSASEVLGKLESAGLLLRTPSESDRRTMNIQLTPAGQETAEEAGRQREWRRQQMFECLSPEEKDVLLVLLKKVNTAWDQQYRKNGARRDHSDRRNDRGPNYRK